MMQKDSRPASRGSAYIEYFLAAAAMFAAAMWLFDGGNLQGIRSSYDARFLGWMGAINNGHATPSDSNGCGEFGDCPGWP